MGVGAEKVMYAIVETGGKQYRVKPGDTVAIEKLTGEPIISGKLQMIGEKIKANKEAMAGYELEAKTKLAKNEAEKQRRLSELDAQYQRELSELNKRRQITELHATVYSKSKWFIGILIAILVVLIFLYIK